MWMKYLFYVDYKCRAKWEIEADESRKYRKVNSLCSCTNKQKMRRKKNAKRLQCNSNTSQKWAELRFLLQNGTQWAINFCALLSSPLDDTWKSREVARASLNFALLFATQLVLSFQYLSSSDECGSLTGFGSTREFSGIIGIYAGNVCLCMKNREREREWEVKTEWNTTTSCYNDFSKCHSWTHFKWRLSMLACQTEYDSHRVESWERVMCLL